MSTSTTSSLFAEFRRHHQARAARRSLDRQLSSYRTGSEIAELEAIATRNPDEGSSAVRDYLHRNGRGAA